MSEMQIDPRIEALVDSEDQERIKLLLWHLDNLEGMGMTDPEAMIKIADHPRCDIYKLKELVVQGCPVEIAWEIIR